MKSWMLAIFAASTILSMETSLSGSPYAMFSLIVNEKRVGSCETDTTTLCKQLGLIVRTSWPSRIYYIAFKELEYYIIFNFNNISYKLIQLSPQLDCRDVAREQLQRTSQNPKGQQSPTICPPRYSDSRFVERELQAVRGSGVPPP